MLTRPRLRPRAVLPLLLTGMLVLAGCGSSSSTGDKGFVDGDGSITRLAPSQRATPGPVRGVTLTGGHASLRQYAGHVVVVNIWADWCAPCRAEAGTLADASRRLRSKGVKFLGVAIRSSQANAAAFERHFHVPYPSILDSDGLAVLAFHGTLTPNTIPSTVVIDSHGRVAASILGQVPSTTTLVDLVHDVSAS